MKWFYYVITNFGTRYEGSFQFDDDGDEAILIAKEILVERIEGFEKNRRGVRHEKGRYQVLRVANHPEVFEDEG